LTQSRQKLHASSEIEINRVRPPAAYELVIEQIRRALALGRFGPGDKLPPERDLTEQLGVSRTVVREAIRVLEGEGLLEVTRGANGGSRVLPAAGEQQMTADEVRDQSAEIEQVMDFRLAVECAAAHAAAERRTDAEAAVIAELVERQERALEAAAAAEDTDERASLTSGFLELDTRFHLAVGAASHNHYLADAVETGRINMLRPIGTIFTTTTEDVNFQHSEIVAAILEGDAEAAETAMRDHITQTRSTALHFLAVTARQG
jgi:GntR family transcriptional regulator, transcriptional repressor for pyruvate dehydrogenase complex